MAVSTGACRSFSFKFIYLLMFRDEIESLLCVKPMWNAGMKVNINTNKVILEDFQQRQQLNWIAHLPRKRYNIKNMSF